MPSHASSTPSAPSTAAGLLSQHFPPLARYYPHLQTVSAPQAAFLILDHREAFYGGAAGGGKSDALLMAALQYVDRPGYNALLLRRTFPELEGSDGLIAKAHDWLGPHRASGEVAWNEQKHRWTFPSGATLQFGHVKDEADKYRYQGQAYQFVGFDELTHFTETIYEYIAFTRARRNMAQTMAGIPVRARAASNPGNVGHGWVKNRFITARRDGVIFVPAKLDDNPGLDRDTYVEDLSYLPEELRLQLLEGDWDAFEGAAYQVGAAHLLSGFRLEDAYDRFEAADYGLNGAPWALVAVDYEGNLVFADMVYERDLIPSQLCPLILAERQREGGWGTSNLAYVDPSIWHRTGGVNKFSRPAMLADEFTDNGVAVTRANNDPRAGMMRLRELLKLDDQHPFPSWHPLAGQKGAPHVFFTGKCARLVQELQDAPLQPSDKPDGGEKVDPEWESRHGHAAAMARYAVLTRPSPSTKPVEEPEDPRAALLWRHEQQMNQSHMTRRRYTNV